MRQVGYFQEFATRCTVNKILKEKMFLSVCICSFCYRSLLTNIPLESGKEKLVCWYIVCMATNSV